MFSDYYKFSKNPVLMFLTVLLVASFLTGCAGQKLGKQTVTVKHYPECYRPITDMRKSAEAVNKATAAGAALGAIAGAAIGYARTGDSKGAIKGAIVGGLTGAGLGYLVSSEVQSMEQADRFRTYFQAMDMDISNLKQAVAAARIASNCYDKQYQQLAKNYKSGRIGKEEMRERLLEIQQGTNDAYTILKNYSDMAPDVFKTYDEVVQLERTRPDRAASSMVSSLTRKRTEFNTTNKSVSSQLAVMDRRKLAYDSFDRSMGKKMSPTIMAQNSEIDWIPCVN
jgi:uncharacterized membrane protein